MLFAMQYIAIHCKQRIVFEQLSQWPPWRWFNKHRNT